MTTQRDIHSNVTAIALFFIFGNSILYLEPIPLLHYFFSAMRMLGVGYAFFLALLNFKIGKFSWMVCFFFAVLGALTLMHQGAMNMWSSFFMNSISISILVYISLLRSPQHTLDILSRIFAIFIYFNFLTMLIAPQGIFQGSYPLGRNYNQVGASLICGIITHSAAYHMGLRKFSSTLILCIVSVITPLVFVSMTSSVGCVLISVFFLIPHKKLRRIIIATFFSFYLIFQAFVVFLQADLSNNKEAAYFVENVLGKELTFSNRTFVWIQAYSLIESSPTTGYGLRTNDWFDSQLHVLSAHNIILQILIYGGKILLFTFIAVIFIAIWRSLKHRSNISDSILFGTCVFFFMMMMENYSIVLIFYVLNLLYYAPELSLAVESTAGTPIQSESQTK